MTNDPRVVTEERGTVSYAKSEVALHNRAHQLEAEGPDEFPYGFYLYLAEFESAEAERDRDS